MKYNTLPTKTQPILGIRLTENLKADRSRSVG